MKRLLATLGLALLLGQAQAAPDLSGVQSTTDHG